MRTIISKIRKRNGVVVDFEPEKITLAMQKAFLAVRGSAEDKRITELTEKVVRDLEQLFPETTPGVEDAQDLVETAIMQDGFFDVAKAYILYRYEHAKRREKEKEAVQRKIETDDLFVTKRSGEREKFSMEKLAQSLSWAIRGFEHIVDVQAVTEQCRAELYDNISTKDIARALMMTVRSFIEQDPAYSRVASRLLLTQIYKEVVGPEVDVHALHAAYREAFVRNIKKGVEAGRFDSRLLDMDLHGLSLKLNPDRDDLFYYLGLQTLHDRYLTRDPQTKELFETPQAMWMRVAMGLALLEKNKTEAAARFYEMISTFRFVPSTPTLFHSGTHHPQLSSCYITTVLDSLDNIFKSIADNAQLSKWSGGLGNDWTNIRATGSLIRTTGVESQGVIPFLKIANDTTVSINRSGRRRGATCAYLETWHYDIEDFIELRKNTGDERRRTHDMDTANWIPDLFMKRVREDGDWTLFSPDEVPDLHHLYGKRFEARYQEYEREADAGAIYLWKRVSARDLWRKMLTMLFETGHPWITFKDPCNIRSPQDHVGVVHSSNLCTEITLNTTAEETAVCNLGSVNLGRHIRGKSLDLDLVKDTVTTAMRMLDNVIDINYYPTAEARNSNLRHRPVGLGIMGFQDALYLLDIQFDSEECIVFADTSMEAISYYAILASSQLAKERGTYETYRGSKWDRGILPLDTLGLLEEERGMKIDVPRTSRMDWNIVRESIRQYGMRNSNCMAIAPTATISNIAGCLPTIEPVYKNIYVKANVSGDFTVVNPYLVEDLRTLNLWDFEMLGKLKYHDGSVHAISEIPAHLREKYKEVFEINPKWLIKAAAYRGKWIDQSQSLNIFFIGSSGKQLDEIYQYAWEMGLKTTYYLRTLAASQVEKATVSTAVYGVTHIRQASAAQVTPQAAPHELPEAVVLEGMAPQPAGMQPLQDISASAPSSQMYIPPAAAALQHEQPIPGFAHIGNVLTNANETPLSHPSSAATPKKELKLCRIDDPNCEACQ